jgi:hypothetical protein
MGTWNKSPRTVSHKSIILISHSSPPRRIEESGPIGFWDRRDGGLDGGEVKTLAGLKVKPAFGAGDHVVSVASWRCRRGRRLG